MPLINFLNLTYTPSHRKVFDTTGNIKITWQLQKSVDTSKAQYSFIWKPLKSHYKWVALHMLCTLIYILGQDKSQTKTQLINFRDSKLYSISKKSKQIIYKNINWKPQWQKILFRIRTFSIIKWKNAELSLSKLNTTIDIV